MIQWLIGYLEAVIISNSAEMENKNQIQTLIQHNLNVNLTLWDWVGIVIAA